MEAWNCPGVKVLSVFKCCGDHYYFNFDMDDLALKTDQHIRFKATQCRNGGRIRGGYIVVWARKVSASNYANPGPGSAHGRFDPKPDAKKYDFQKGDVVVTGNGNCQGT